MHSDLKINDELHGFKLIDRTHLDELRADTFQFVHLKTGAKLFFIAADDDNKVFYIGFRTPPTDDTGVAHIIEHSLLCGSKKYPLKEPFVELVKGSLNTFLNAMTYPDKTVYPVASRNPKDFRNLEDVYLDAVFNPAIYSTPEILMQEGWHYEINDQSEPLTYSGVVYNEMKGALSSPESILGSKICRAVYPDTCYHFESGGDPEAIPSLTLDAFIDFHKRYYHPSNSYIYLYGDVDIDDQLAYLDREYLSKYDRLEIDSSIARQQPFDQMRRDEDFYPIGDEEDERDKTFLTLSFLVGDVLDTTKPLALNVLEQTLLVASAAPLRKALVDAHIGKDVDSSFDEDYLQPTFTVQVSGAEAARLDEFYELTMSTLKKLATDGIDRSLLQASINTLEFGLREADFGGTPRGLVYGLRALKSWLYDADPNMHLRYEDSLAELKAGLNSRYYEQLIEEYFLNNPHRVLFTLKPSKTVAKEREARQAEALEKIKASLTSNELQSIVDNANRLKARQQAPETPEALETIPILKLEDIRKEAERLPLKFRDLDGTRILDSCVETNGIIYLNFFFDATRVPQSKRFHAQLLMSLLGEVDTKNHTYEEFTTLTDTHLGGIGMGLQTYIKNGMPDSFNPKCRLTVKALASKLPEMTDILIEMLTESIFINKKRIRELIEEQQIGIELSLQRNAQSIVVLRLASYLSKAGAYLNEGVLPYNKFLKELLANFDKRFDDLVDELYDVLTRLINKNGLIVGVTANDDVYKQFVPHLSRLLKALPTDEFKVEHYHFPLKAKNEGFMSQSRVQYVGKGANFINLGFEFTGALGVLETIMRYEYMWTLIRVQGGAYGAMTSFTRSGAMHFCSYRDPNLSRTLAVFDRTADFLSNFNVSDREMDKYIIGTVSKLDHPLTPSMKGNLAMECYMRSITFDDRQKYRDEVLATRQETIRGLAPLIDACMKANNLCVFGNEELLRQNKSIFGELVNVNA
ncbi:MAG: insulinase family protein [Selenomonadaceae bacterium]|nr:insulinase family protein [Selenomonadaceae bacterium]